MVTQQLAGWARSRGYRYVSGNSEGSDVIACPVGGYTFGFGYEEDVNKRAVAQGAAGLLGLALAWGVTQSYQVKLAVDHDTWQKQALKELKSQMKPLAVPSYRKGMLAIRMKKSPHHDDTFQRMEQMAGVAAGVLAAAGVRIKDECVYCGQPGCDSVGLPPKGAGRLSPAHASCSEEFAQQNLEKLREKSVSERYVPAVFMAALGVVLGAIPSLIIIPLGYYGGLINILAYALIPIAAFGMYRRANGPVRWPIIPLVFLLTGASILALMLWGDYLWACEEYGKIPFMGYVGEFLTDPYYVAATLIELVVDWVAGLVGMIIGWTSARREKRRKDALIGNYAPQQFQQSQQPAMSAPQWNSGIGDMRGMDPSFGPGAEASNRDYNGPEF